MELKEKLSQLHSRVSVIKENITTEEATKNAFIMPFIQILGYDVFNPTEVVPEFVADIGTKKGEKIDYAILKDNKPIIVIECKHWKENLDAHKSQLHRYFNVAKSRFALLTNGIQYEFYTDLERSNVMDKDPFLVVNLERLKDINLKELNKFHKDSFNVDDILNSASSLKYIQSIKNEFDKELNNPSSDLVKLLVNGFYDGVITAKRLENFTDYTKLAIKSYISDKINSRLRSALSKEETIQVSQEEDLIEEIAEIQSKIITTEEELEAFQIIKAILRKEIPSKKIHYRDTQSYFGVLYENNNRKPICRLYLDGKQKRIELFDVNKKSEKYNIESIDDIYSFSKKLLEIVELYNNNNKK